MQFGFIDSWEKVVEGIIVFVMVNDIFDFLIYLEQKLLFNFGDNNMVVIYFFNGLVEVRLDNFIIDVGVEGFVFLFVGFNIEQSEENFLEYVFINILINVISYEWDFGDGNMLIEEFFIYVYVVVGEYMIILIVFSDVGLLIEFSKSINILVLVIVVFIFQVDLDDYCIYDFMDVFEGVVMLLWEFGDGYQFIGMNFFYIYMEDGEYIVILIFYSVMGNMDVVIEKLIVF